MAFNDWIETTPATGSVAMYDLKEMLKAAGWTVESSSDGTTYNSSGDEISSGASGAGGMANTSAWFRISNPDGVEYVCQRGINNLQWRVKVSPTVGFTGGSPGATQVPSATDEGIVLGGGTDASPSYENLFTTDGTYRHKGGADDASPYHFWSGAFPTGGGAQNHCFVHEGLEAVEPTDAAPFHTVIGNAVADDVNLPGESESSSSTRSFATVPYTTPGAPTWDVFPALRYQSVSAQVYPVFGSTNPISTKDEAFPIVYARRGVIANPGYKGVGFMMKWLGVSRTTGDTLTVDSTRDRIVFGDVSFPWQGTVPTV